jgi:hypothetical protein
MLVDQKEESRNDIQIKEELKEKSHVLVTEHIEVEIDPDK